MNRRNLPTILVIAVAALLSAAMSLGASAGGTQPAGTSGDAAAAHHAASEAQVRYRVVRRCRLVPVKRAGKVVKRRGKVVKRRVCKRVRVRVPVRVTTTPTTPTTPTAPGPTTVTAPGTTTAGTTTGTTTAVPQPELSVREFVEAGSLRLTLSAAAVPAGTYTVKRRSEGPIGHDLDVRPTGAATATVTFPTITNGEDVRTVVLTPGSWTFRCTVPGHSAMTATLTVTP